MNISAPKSVRTLLLSALLFLPSVMQGVPIKISAKEVEQALEQLDDSLPLRNAFIAKRQERINALRDSLRDDNPAYIKVLHDIIDRYSSFNNDSAMFYAELGSRTAADDGEALRFRLRRTALMPLAGFHESAIYDFDNIDSASVPSDIKTSYYDAGRQMYSFIYGLFPTYDEFNESMGRRLLDMQERLMANLPVGSLARNFSTGEYYMLTGEYARAKAYFQNLIEKEGEADDYRARIAHHLATIAREEGEDNEYAYYLAVSALADLTAGTLEVKSLQELGGIMFERGDVDRAYSYLSIALENAVECGASMRMVESARSMPLIEQAHSGQIDSWRRMIYVVIGIMLLLLLGMATLLVLLRREMNNMSVLQQNLRSANRIKEVYISQFMSLCSIYMDKLNSFCKIVNRKLAIGKADDLYKLTNSGKFVEEQTKEFYDVFDNAFLHIYPDFVSQVNSLLRPDAQIVLKDDEQLNTELRILAFVRLGIQDSPRIAQVLNYSLNTIYSYRNRLKNKAVNRDTFERDVMNLSSL
ncbi:MAG: hypothetical protein K2G24_00475 [Muribaculaceae bacterium]|nr:hypothetical protein [Muribaculaceae bacterium]